ncbi:MAG: FkbM family methyltransferase [Nitrospira sp.]|nr:FkbM family methyltransferase [Nitrospira sp.]
MAPHLRQYMQMFGTFEGARIYVGAKYGRQELRLNVPGLRSHLVLRGGTSDRPTFQKVFFEHEYDVDLGFQPRLIVDGGANVGYASVYFAHRFPEALVLAVEPDPGNFRLLTSNTEAYQNIRRFNYALWPRQAFLKIENPSGNQDSFRVAEVTEKAVHTIPAISIPDLLKQTGAESIDLLKLDIEGAEKELFEDEAAAGWISRIGALIVELHDRFKPGCSTAVERALTGQPFRRSQKGESLLFLHDSTA